MKLESSFPKKVKNLIKNMGTYYYFSYEGLEGNPFHLASSSSSSCDWQADTNFWLRPKSRQGFPLLASSVAEEDLRLVANQYVVLYTLVFSSSPLL